jgi:ATP-binding cassette subfamily F protein 3
LGAETIEADTIKVLEGLGFKQTDFDRHTSDLSGGWLMRIELAKILLQHPDVILLDEPTNHLDIESIQWLEEWMNMYSGVVLMVSHDRTFLNTVTNRTIEISNQKIYDYKCKYDDYLIERVTQRELQLATQKNQMKEYERTEALIDKFRAKASKATMAQSLIKKLDKMEVMEIDNDDTSSMKFTFPDAPRSGLTVVEVKNLSKSYGEKNILRDVGLKIERGEKVGFVGKNGMGKTTMGKMIVGEENFEGILDLGSNVSIGYYAQHQSEKLESNDTVLETIENAMHAGSGTNARSLLGAFLFSGENVTKKVKVLSGGEKSRLSLAKLMLEEHNVLILDEPTNHLDIRSIEVLKEALSRFNGTIIIISHDRDFLAGLATKTFEFLDGNVKEYLGDINYFLDQKKLTNIRDFEEQMAVNLKAKEKKIKEEKIDNRVDDKDAERRKKDLKNCEEKISTTEHALSVIEAKMGNMTDFQGDEYKKLFAEHQKLKNELTALMTKWEELAS